MVTSVNRFRDLTNAIPSGPFYAASGQILPLRDEPYQFRFDAGTARASHSFKVYVNDVLAGATTANGIGVALVELTLEAGDQNIVLVDDADGRRFLSPVTIRHSATWHAAQADVIEELDGRVDDIERGLSIATATPAYIEALGRMVRQPDPSDINELVVYSTDSYRRLIQELRGAYRHFGGHPLGMRQAVSAFTSVSPFVVPREWRPHWILGAQLLVNGDLETRSRYSTAQYAAAGTTTELPNLNANSRTAVITTIAGASTATSGFTQPPHPQRLTVTFAAAGTATISGTTDVGAAVAETLTAAGAGTLTSTLEFASVTSVVNTSASAIAVGTGDSRFIKILTLGSYNKLGAATLSWNTGSPGNLVWNGGAPVNVTTGGTYTLTTAATPAYAHGRVAVTPSTGTFDFDPVGTGVEANFHDQLWVLRDVSYSRRIDLGGASETIANVVTTINSSLIVGATEIVGTEEATDRSVLRLNSSLSGELARVSLMPGPGDASLQLMGLPRSSSTLDAGASAAATSLSVVDSTRMPTVAGPQLARNIATAPLAAVAIQSVSQGTTYGVDGQLQLVVASATSKTLAWKAPGATLGTAQNVVAGGEFTLASGTTPAMTITVVVESDLLPAASGTTNNAVEVYSPSTFRVRVRGLRRAAPAGADNGSITGTTSTCTFSSASYTFGASDVGGHVRVSNAVNTNNNGIHRIVGVSGGNATLLNQRAGASSTTGVFVTEATIKFAVWHQGEIVTVNENDLSAPGTLTLSTPLTLAWPEHAIVEVVDEAPYTERGVFGAGEMEVEVDLDYAPASTSNSVTAVGTNVPDGIEVVSSGTTAVAGNMGTTHQAGLFSPSRLILVSAATTEIELRASAPLAVLHKGKRIVLEAWVQEHTEDGAAFTLDVSFDDGVTWTNTAGATPDAAVLRLVTDTTDEGPLDPTQLRGHAWVPYDAESCTIRLVREAPGAGTATISVEKLTVTADNATGFWLGTDTVIRSAKRAAFGEMLYVWSPEPLSSREREFMGMPPEDSDSSLPDAPGHIDLVSNAHGYWERVDMTAYDGDEVATNVKGLYTELDWLTAPLIGMEVIVGTPAKLSFIRPTRLSDVTGEELLVVAGAGNDATLTLDSAHEGSFPQDPSDRDRLYETLSADRTITLPSGRTVIVPEGSTVPVPSTPTTAPESTAQPWQFIAADEIRIHNDYYDASSTYSLDYGTLMRVTTPMIDLGADYLDNLWLIDMAHFTRRDVEERPTRRVQQLTFAADASAGLNFVADTDSHDHVLTRDDGVTREVLNAADWSFSNNRTVQLAAGTLETDSIYSLDYAALVPRPYTEAELVLEWQPTDSGGTALQDYQVVTIGQVVSQATQAVSQNGFRYHRLRVTASNMRDVRDFRIYGLGLKGIRIFGDEYAPGILTP